MAVRIRNEFYSLNDTRYRVEVHDSDYVGSVITSFEDNGFDITWDNEDDDFLAAIKPSTCRYVLYNDFSVNFATFRNDIASAAEKEFHLVIYKWDGAAWDLFWCGVILTDIIQWHNESPKSQFEIIAKDGLNRLEYLRFTNVDSAPFTSGPEDFMYIIERILNKNGLAQFHTGDYIKVSIDWNEVGQTLATPQRILEYVRIWGDLLKEYHKENEQAKETTQPYDCKFILNALLRLFAARIIYSEGCYHIQQVTNFTTDTYNEAVYDNAGAYSSTNTSVTNKRSTDANFYPMSGGIYGYHAAYNRVKCVAKGYLDVKGAYIDAVIVDGSNTTYSKTLKLGRIYGGGSAYASTTILAADNSLGVDIELIAQNIGVGGNSITFTGNGSAFLQTQINTWNTANPNNKVSIVSPTSNKYTAVVDNGVVVALSGGVTGSLGGVDRCLEIDFDLGFGIQISDAEASNFQCKVDVKLICGSNRIKNVTKSPAIMGKANCEWSITAADKWSYVVNGNDLKTHKVALITPEIPFESEDDCTIELTVQLQRKYVSMPWPDENKFWASFTDFKVVAWDSNRNVLADQEVIVENPTTADNSIEYDFGTLLIGDDPVVQSSISSKNYLDVNDGSGLWYRSAAWDASFDDDYGLIRTLLFEAIALRKTPVEKYTGTFIGDYAAHKSIGYDSSRWVTNMVKYDAKLDEWNGAWWRINYSQGDITVSNERLLPSAIVPTRRVYNPAENDRQNANPKGTGNQAREPQTFTTTVETDALDTEHFRSGDTLMVYHPKTDELLYEMLITSDTAVNDTSIDVDEIELTVGMPDGVRLEHNSKLTIETTTLRSQDSVLFGGEFVGLLVIDETDFSTGIGFYYYQLTPQNRYTIVTTTSSGSDRVYLPLIADSIKHGMSVIVTIKANESLLFYPHPTDTTAGAEIFTINIGSPNLAMSGGNQRTFITDGTDWHTIQF